MKRFALLTLALAALTLCVPISAAADAAWMTGYVTTSHGQLLTGAKVCVKQGNTSCTTSAKGFWLVTGLQSGAAEVVVICLPAERDNQQPVRQVTLQPGRNYDGLFRTGCLLTLTQSPTQPSPTPAGLAHTGGAGA